MEVNTGELKRVMREQSALYEKVFRSIWGDRIVLAMTATALGGVGMGLLFHEKWRTRMLGAMLYATAGGMELYAAMTPKTREARGGEEMLRPESRAA